MKALKGNLARDLQVLFLTIVDHRHPSKTGVALAMQRAVWANDDFHFPRFRVFPTGLAAVP